MAKAKIAPHKFPVNPKGQLVQGTCDTKGKNGLELLPTSPGVEGKFAVNGCVAQKF